MVKHLQFGRLMVKVCYLDSSNFLAADAVVDTVYYLIDVVVVVEGYIDNLAAIGLYLFKYYIDYMKYQVNN